MDAAEKYWAAGLITEGSVVVICDHPGCEIRYSSTDADERVLGVVSEIFEDKAWPLIKLRGRIKVKAMDEVRKGDLLVTSDILGTTRSATWIEKNFKAQAIFAKALSDSENGWVEAVIL